MTQFCPRCFKCGPDIETCTGSDFGIPCPPPTEETPGKDILLSCGPCEFKRLVPVGKLLSGKAKNQLPKCARDDCACVAVPGEVSCPVLPEQKSSPNPKVAKAAHKAAAKVEEAKSGD